MDNERDEKKDFLLDNPLENNADYEEAFPAPRRKRGGDGGDGPRRTVTKNGNTAKRKQRRNIFIAGIVCGAMLSSILHMTVLKPKAPGKEKEETPVENPLEQLETPVETPVVEEPALPVPEELMEGKNHSNQAAEYAHDVEMVNEWVKSGRDSETKTVFLTFDDGPGKYTNEVLDILKEKEVPATFFLIGEKIEKTSASDAVWKRYIEEGHGLALHSYSHDYGKLYSERTPIMSAVKEEWDESLALLKERVGESFNTRVFRFPGGAMSWRGIVEARAELKEAGIIDIDWNAMTGDSEAASKRPQNMDEVWARIQDDLTRTAHPETAVLLMHDVKEDTPKYLAEIIEKLKAEGYTFGILY